MSSCNAKTGDKPEGAFAVVADTLDSLTSGSLPEYGGGGGSVVVGSGLRTIGLGKAGGCRIGRLVAGSRSGFCRLVEGAGLATG